MISYSIDETGRVLALSYSGHVTPRQLEDFRKAFHSRVDQLRRGFVLLGDLTNLESMDPGCAEGIGAFMELLSERDMGTVLRVIPDPSKDIGLNLISLFHYRKPVRAYTLPNLAEALIVLLDEAERLQPSDSGME